MFALLGVMYIMGHKVVSWHVAFSMVKFMKMQCYNPFGPSLGAHQTLTKWSDHLPRSGCAIYMHKKGSFGRKKFTFSPSSSFLLS